VAYFSTVATGLVFNRRQHLGYQLTDAGWLLPDFIDYLHRHGAEHVSTELALEWATQPVNTSQVWWRQRLNVVRAFAQYLRTIDPDTDVPPRDQGG
jgi:integrase/recombinase XerD